MTTIAVLGAGPGPGAATARRFAADGFTVALPSRTQQHVDALAEEMWARGGQARGHAANVRDPSAPDAALDRAATDLGPVEVLHAALELQQPQDLSILLSGRGSPSTLRPSATSASASPRPCRPSPQRRATLERKPGWCPAAARSRAARPPRHR